MKRWLCAAGVLLILLHAAYALAAPAAGSGAAAAASKTAAADWDGVKISAECAVVYDTLTGRFLYEKNADQRHLIASTTKIMTALTALAAADPAEKVRVDPAAVRVEGSRMYLEAGEELTVLDLLYGLLLCSGNDAGLALAYYCGGGDPADFVEQMNALADSLGLWNTAFENPHGLDGEGHFSTARDLAVLSAYAMENPVFAQVVSAKYYQMPGRSMKNHNRLLWRLEGAEGIKTGFTRAAGRCLVSSVQRGGRRIIVVTLNDPDDWNDHAALYARAFADMSVQAYHEAGQRFATLPVQSGTRRQVEVTAKEGLSMYLSAEEAARAEYLVFLPQFVYAPVKAGAVAGRAELRLDGAVLASVPLYYAQDVGLAPGEPSWWERAADFFAGLFARLRGG